jgi:Arc/MetJ family transcription regulator
VIPLPRFHGGMQLDVRYHLHRGADAMRTTLNLDNSALAEAMAHAEGRNKTQVINEALRQFARAKRRKGLLELRGQVPWEGDLDRLRKRS